MTTLDLQGIGKVEVDDSFTSMSARDQEKTIHEIAARVGQKPAAPPQGSDWSRAITGMHEEGKRSLGEVAGSAMANLKGAFTPIEHPPDEGFLKGYGREVAATAGKTGKFFSGLGQTVATPFMYPIGAAASLTGRPLAHLIHKTGELIAPETAAQHTPEDVYQQIRPDVMTALQTNMPGRVPAPKVAVPSKDQLFETANKAYGDARRLDVAMEPASTRTLANNIKQTLDVEGFKDYTTPGTFRVLEQLKEPKTKMQMTDEAGNTSTEVVAHLNDVLGVRQVLNRLTANPNEKAAANLAIKKVDTYIGNLIQDRPAILGEAGPEAARLVGKGGEGPGNYAAAKRAETLEKAGDRADLNAASAGSGANIDNATRQAVKSILINPKKLRGFSEDEIGQMHKIVEGTFVGNAARLLGKLAPKDIVSAAAGGSAGFAAGGPVGTAAVWGLGFSAKKLSDHITKAQYNKLDGMIRSRSPLGQQMEAPLRKWVEAGQQFSVQPTIQSFAKFQMAGSNLANNLKDIGIRINPADLIRTLQGPVPAPAENE